MNNWNPYLNTQHTASAYNEFTLKVYLLVYLVGFVYI